LSDGGVHSHIDHIIAMAKIAKNAMKKVFIHVITDGRDVSPDCAKKYINQILEICDEDIKIATIAGRYYTMDRDNRWDRVQKGYDAIAFANPSTTEDILNYVNNSYKDEIFDEFLVPTAFEGYKGLEKNDGVIFCNFRSDRMREISSVFANKDFKEFNTFKESLNLATMTQYDKNTPIDVLFPKDSPKNTLAEVISNAGLSQLHTAETEKYAHVTFFFNGGVEEPMLNETRVLIPSPSVATYDLKPEMSAPQVGDAVRTAMNNDIDFIVVNFANGDMVGHTGIFEAAVKSVEAVDLELGLIFEVAKKQNYNVLLTSDHGNCEMMKDDDGNILTNHTVGDVYCFVYAEGINEVKTGSLNNIAPTVLKLMNLEIPQEMDEPLI
jgi:2,3-bisphosphoglycerate-independent phosphoglycerate mutase